MYPMEVDKFIENTNQPSGRFTNALANRGKYYRRMESVPPWTTYSGSLWLCRLLRQTNPITCDHCGVVHLLEPHRVYKLPIECPYCGQTVGENG